MNPILHRLDEVHHGLREESRLTFRSQLLGRLPSDVHGYGACASTASGSDVTAMAVHASASVSPPPQLGGPQEKMSFFQIASAPILSIPIYFKTC